MSEDIWSEDELVIVLDAYLNEGANAYERDNKVEELHKIMNRSKGSIALRIANFKHLNPLDNAEGMENGGEHCESVWKNYRDSKHELKEAAQSIKEDLGKDED